MESRNFLLAKSLSNNYTSNVFIYSLLFSMLSSHYRYIALDFETTGLDIHSDEPIQIGIAEIDAEGNLIGGFQSLLRPAKSPKQLKSIVGFITGLSLEQLQSSPSPDELLPEIEQFFGERTIIIGHNIGFDLAFLQKFFPSLRWKMQIDTFKLSQDLMHYVPSYAQEVLIQQLQTKPEFHQKMDEFGLGGEVSFHDAFFDAKLSLLLFLHLIQRAKKLLLDYPILQYLLAKSTSQLKTIFPDQQTAHLKLLAQESLPPLKKIAPANTQLQNPPYPIQFENLADKSSFHVQNLNLKDLLASLATQKKIILSFSTKPKLDIAKNLLNDLGIKNL